MPRSIKRLTKNQVGKDFSNSLARNKANALSQKNSDSTEESDSDVKLDMLKPTNVCNNASKGTPVSQGLVENEVCSSDEGVSQSQCSKLDIAREDMLPMNTNSPICSDDVINQVQPNVDKNQTYNTVFDGSSESDDDSDAESRKEILRSAEKRIIRNISTSESDTRNMRVHEKYESSSDSDSAPESVTFEVGRKTAMEVLKQRVNIIRQEKVRKKEQRKKKLENLQKQKEDKILRLKARQTSIDNALKGSSSSESTSKLLEKQNPLKDINLGKKIYFSSESETTERKTKSAIGNSVGMKQNKCLKRLPANLVDNLPDQVTQKQQKQFASIKNSDLEDLQSNKKQIRVDNSQMQWDTDYIPLDNSGVTQFGAVPLNKIGLRKKTVSEEAAAFRHNMIYGSKNTRAPANMNSIRQQKLKACGLDRLVTRR